MPTGDAETLAALALPIRYLRYKQGGHIGMTVNDTSPNGPPLAVDERKQLFGLPAPSTRSEVWQGALAQEFTISLNIVVSALGFYDSGQDGLQVVRFGIFNQAGTAAVVGPFALEGRSGELRGGYRFIECEPVELGSGTYTIGTMGSLNTYPRSEPTELETEGVFTFSDRGRFSFSPNQIPVSYDAPGNYYRPVSMLWELAETIIITL